MTPAGQCAEALIAELGISGPVDLDVDAIAFDSGVKVVYKPLTGCEATLVGYGAHAIATINPSPVRGRERFSVAHELGHWHRHRGRSFQCRVDDPDASIASDRTLEREADTFASHLLMPGPLFNPLVRQLGTPNFKQLADLAGQFETSLMATALRLASINTLPVIVACYGKEGRRWHLAAEDIPRRWFLNRKLDPDTFTYDLLNEGKECRALSKQSADSWFETEGADRFEVFEQCIASHAGQALVLLYLESSMLESSYGRPSRGTDAEARAPWER